MKIAVVGTGISGLSVAQMLKEHHEVVLFEKADRPGGLIKCVRLNDCLFHQVGGHVFNSRNEEVLKWFWRHFDRDEEFLKVKRNAKVFLKNQMIGYPIENYIYLLEKDLIKKIFGELLLLQQKPKLSPLKHDNLESFLRSNFGNTLFEVYFEPYNKKIWQTDLSKVSMEWLEGKLPMPDLEEIILSNILREEENSMVHSTFYYPREGGSQFLVDRLSERLTIMTNFNVKEASKVNDTFVIGEESGFDKVIFSGDIRCLPEKWKALLREKGADVDYISQLKSNGTTNLFCETDDTDISWLYIPEPFVSAHRIIYTGNFSPTNNRGAKRKTCVVEFSGKVDFEMMTEEIKKLPGNLTPLTSNYEPNSYIIQDKKTRKEITAVKKILEEEGIFLLGRFAEWEYYNMDTCIKAAISIADKLNAPVMS